METISITTLTPATFPPADKAIRAVVTLFWPYSSSTKQCALLLADPDFRLRSRKGQVRVRFTGASAEAVAKGKVGIGDEVLLELRGSTWAGNFDHVDTPGRSVDGELLFKGELALTIVRKVNGEDVGTRISINESTPPPEEDRTLEFQTQQRNTEMDAISTPVRATPSYLRSSLGGVDVVPIYSSPAFVRRLRLSEERKSSSWDPFAEVDEEFEQHPRKKQRISFGNVGRWRVAERTPSPEVEDIAASDGMEDVVSGTTEAVVEKINVDAARLAAEEPATLRSKSDTTPGPSHVQIIEGAPSMPPPPLPRLLMPDNAVLQSSATSESDGPSTPKLQPVPSSALPLPSPFPVDSSQRQLGIANSNTTDGATASAIGDILVSEESPILTQIEEHESRHNVSVAGESHVVDEASMDLEQTRKAITDSSNDLPVTDMRTQGQAETIARSLDQRQQHSLRDNHYSSQLSHSQVENLSDTEEDEEMYYDHMRRRFPTFDERGYIRVDHQEEGYYDDLSQIGESEAEEVIEPDESQVEPEELSDSGEEGGDEDEADDSEAEFMKNDGTHQREEPTSSIGHVMRDDEAVDVIGHGFPNTSTAQESLSTRLRSESHRRQQKAPRAVATSEDPGRDPALLQQHHSSKTAAAPFPQSFGLDGAADTPVTLNPTPQSERDKIMRKTYSSLFGFKGSPSPERRSHELPQLQTPTPASRQGLLAGPSRPILDYALADVSSRDDEPQNHDLKPNDGVALQSTKQASAGSHPEQGQVTAVAKTLVSDLDPADPLSALIADSGVTQDKTIEQDGQSELREQAAEATAETGNSMQVADVDDGSLLAAVRADETRHEAEGTHAVELPENHGAPVLGDSVDLAVEAHRFSQDQEMDNDATIEEAGPTSARSGLTEMQVSVQASSPEEAVEIGEVSQGRSQLLAAQEPAPKCVAFKDADVTIHRPAPEVASSLDSEITPQETEEPVPDGVAINKALGEAIAPTQSRQIQQSNVLSSGSVPPTSQQIEVIDLGSSDNEAAGQEDSSQNAARPSRQEKPEEHDEPVDVFSPQFSQEVFAQPGLLGSPSIPDTQPPSQTTNQHSQRSAPDMLDVTQTTLDRSEIETPTPTAPEMDTMIPDAVEESGIWTQAEHQSFFADQLHAAELPGTQIALTQNNADTIGDAYHYFSFQSTTSVATDNSEDRGASLPIAAQQSLPDVSLADHDRASNTAPVQSAMSPLAEHAAEVYSSALPSRVPDVRQGERVEIDRSSQENGEVMVDVISQVTASHHPAPTDLASPDIEMGVSGPDAPSPVEAPSEDAQQQPDSSLDAANDQSEMSQILETSHVKADETKPTLSERSDRSESGNLRESQQGTNGLVFDSAQSTLPRKQEPPDAQSSNNQASHAALPISPEDSQHRFEAQSFATQIPDSILPPTPQLTQGDSLAKVAPEILVDAAELESGEEGVTHKEAATPRRARGAGENNAELETPVRRSTRKSQADTQASPEATEVSEPPALRTRSRSSTIDKTTQPVPPKRQPAKHGKAQTQPEHSDQTTRTFESASQTAASQEIVAATDANDELLKPEKRTPVRRSPRKLHAESQTAGETAEESEESVTVNKKPEQASKRTSSRRVQTTAMGKEQRPADDSTAAENATPKRTSAPKSMTSRISGVPEVISNWFSPRRSTRHGPDKGADAAVNVPSEKGHSSIPRSTSSGFATKLSYYTPLSNLEEKLNPSSQSMENATEVLAVVTDATSAAERAKGGPRHFFTVFHVADPSLAQEHASVRVEVYRPWHATLPAADVGDVVLLRSFAVKSRKRQPYLLSTDSSAWCVWRHAEEEEEHPSDRRATQRSTRLRSASQAAAAAAGVREEIKGPPVELGDEERERAGELRTWWVDSVHSGTRAPDAAVAAKTRSGTL